ncbi:MAG: hypothetical protein JWO14_771 [Solirubrobacterales bacterium]|nr:hypothetical protein [Solirubrobacterales bacterium]
MDGLWEREIASGWLGELVLKEISADPSILVGSQGDPVVERNDRAGQLSGTNSAAKYFASLIATPRS